MRKSSFFFCKTRLNVDKTLCWHFPGSSPLADSFHLHPPSKLLLSVSISLNRWRCQWIYTWTHAKAEPWGSFACLGVQSCLCGSQRFLSRPGCVIRRLAKVKDGLVVTEPEAQLLICLHNLRMNLLSLFSFKHKKNGVLGSEQLLP